MLFFISVLKIHGETDGAIIFFLLFLYGLSTITLSFVFIPLFNQPKSACFIFGVINIIISSSIHIHLHVDTSDGVKWLTSLLSPIALWLGLTEVCVLRPLISFHQMIPLQKLWKKFFVSSKDLFSFSRYSNFCIFVFPSFLPVSHCFRGWSKKNLQVYDIINCLNKNLIKHFLWYLEKEIRCGIETLSIDRVLNKGHFYGKIMQKMCTKS